MKKNLFHFEIFTPVIIFLNNDFVTICKYINFNNLRKKKWFVDKGVVVGWSSLLWKHKKQLRKHKKKEEKIRKTIYYLNSEKQWKHFFIVLKKMVFENMKNTKKTKTHLFSQTNFFYFLFSRTENSFWKQESNMPLVLFGITLKIWSTQFFLLHIKLIISI